MRRSSSVCVMFRRKRGLFRSFDRAAHPVPRAQKNGVHHDAPVFRAKGVKMRKALFAALAALALAACDDDDNDDAPPEIDAAPRGFAPGVPRPDRYDVDIGVEPEKDASADAATQDPICGKYGVNCTYNSGKCFCCTTWENTTNCNIISP